MNRGIIGLLIILDDDEKDIGPGGIVLEVFFNSLPEINRDGHEDRIYTPSKIVQVKLTYRETISSSVPNSCSCKGLDSLGDFPIFG